MAGPRTTAKVKTTSTRKAQTARIEVQIVARYRAKVKPSVLRKAAQAARVNDTEKNGAPATGGGPDTNTAAGIEEQSHGGTTHSRESDDDVNP